jgi:hypothetical protein
MQLPVQVGQADPVVVDQIQRTDAGPDKRFHRISAHTADPKDCYPAFRQVLHSLQAQQELCS